MSQELIATKVDSWGRIIINSTQLFDLIYKDVDVESLFVSSDDKIDEYNKWCKDFGKNNHIILPATVPLHSPEQEHQQRSLEWFIDHTYEKVNVRASLIDRCINKEETDRVNMEMDMFEDRELIPLLRFMFSLVDYFRQENIVWGVGRGSSCASYCLYLIGVHKIDSIKYKLDISEFLKPNS